MSESTVIVTVENRVGENGIFLNSAWIGFHTDEFDLFSKDFSFGRYVDTAGFCILHLTKYVGIKLSKSLDFTRLNLIQILRTKLDFLSNLTANSQ